MARLVNLARKGVSRGGSTRFVTENNPGMAHARFSRRASPGGHHGPVAVNRPDPGHPGFERAVAASANRRPIQIAGTPACRTPNLPAGMKERREYSLTGFREVCPVSALTRRITRPPDPGSGMSP